MKAHITATEKWVEKHPYLKEVALLPLAIEKELMDSEVIKDVPELDRVLDTFLQGVPLLEIDGVFNLNKVVSSLLIKLANLANYEELPSQVRDNCKKLSSITEEQAENIVSAVISGNEDIAKNISKDLGIEQDLLLYLVWNCIRVSLYNIKEDLEEWLYKQNWQAAMCPVCGSHPVSAMLKRTKRGRERFLHCDHCGTDWRYKRIGCPYCGNIDQKKMSIKDCEDEPDIRLDLCHKCNTYIKTYIGTDRGSVGVDDWASIHLDLLMNESGFSKKTSLMKLG